MDDIELTPTQEFCEIKQSRRRGQFFALLFGAATLGGICYFVLSAQDASKVAEETKPVATVAAQAVPAAPAAVATPPVKTAAPTVYFAYRDFRINGSTAAELDLWAERLLGDRHLTLQLDGHCDERGTDRYNASLGQKRAAAAKAYLVAKGIAPQRLRTVSYGRGRPAAAGHDELAWSQNRRVELHSDMTLSKR